MTSRPCYQALSLGGKSFIMPTTLPHAKTAAARQLLASAAEFQPVDGTLYHAHDIQLESRRLFLSLVVAPLRGSAKRAARRAPQEPQAPLPFKEVHEQEHLRVLHKLGATRSDARAAPSEPSTAGALAALASD